MEFINYIRHDTTSKTNLKSIKTKLNHSKKKELKGLGSYLEVTVLKKGHKSIIKIPFFNTYKDKFIKTNDVNYLNRDAKKVVRKVFKKNTPKFDLSLFINDTNTEINNQISKLGERSNDVQKKNNLISYQDNILNKATKKDSYILVKNEIEYLKDFINKGLKIDDFKSNDEKTKLIKEYLDKYERLEKLKAQKKKFTWSEKKGFKKLNNKYTKSALAVALAALVGLGIYEFNKDNTKKEKSIDTKINKENTLTKPKNTIPLPSKNKNQDVTILSDFNKYDLESEAITTAYEFNLNLFSSLNEIITNRDYGYSFEQVVYGYTFVEHAEEINSKNIKTNEIQDFINASRVLISILVENNAYNQIPLNNNTLDILNNCLNNNANVGIEFVKNAKENNVPLLDMLVVGEELSYILTDNTLYDFNTKIYFKEINEYFNSLIKGELIKEETIKVLKLSL